MAPFLSRSERLNSGLRKYLEDDAAASVWKRQEYSEG